MRTFLGNARVVEALRGMLAADRLPQTILFSGPAGVGKATLARLLAAALNCAAGPGQECGECKHCKRILGADLSRPEYRKLLEERSKASAERRRENPLIISTHPDFLIFPPEGPLAQISIEQVRRLKEHAQFAPLECARRLFLIDQADRMDAAAANSLLKTLEEPPPYLTIVLTAENAFDLLPTIRSRCVPFFFAPLNHAEMSRYLESRPEIAAHDRAKLASWADGSPGRALAIDIATYEKRRSGMLALLRTAARQSSFGELLPHTEALGRSKQERLELHLDMLYTLLEDLLSLHTFSAAPHRKARVVNADISREITSLARQLHFGWLERAAARVDELDALARRNIQKQIALEAIAISLR